jgi:superoxide dismutase, Cu-Zn family
MRRPFTLLLLVSGLALGACGAPAATPNLDRHPPSPSPTARAFGTFAAPGGDNPAVTYDQDLVPVGATAEVVLATLGPGSEFRLNVAGLVANRAYGAHLHIRPCGATGDAAGPHYQHSPDPAASLSPPSVDPSYANPLNEVWLDFTTDGAGAANVTMTESWQFPAGQGARSLVIHAESTRFAPGQSGTAGARAACLTLPA